MTLKTINSLMELAHLLPECNLLKLQRRWCLQDDEDEKKKSLEITFTRTCLGATLKWFKSLLFNFKITQKVAFDHSKSILMV